MNYHIAVLDIGKTNKKIVIYDQELQMVDSTYREFPPLIKNNLPIEQTAEVANWLLEELSHFSKIYTIKSISCTTHGAACVCVDKLGNIVVPVVDYTYEPGDDFHKEFFEKTGDPISLQKETATLELKSLINLSQQIYFLQKTFPLEFEKVDYIVPYPQFFGMVLTGKASTDYTYLGCHTYLWDPQKKDLSSVPHTLNFADKIPTNRGDSADILGTITPEVAQKTGLHPDTIVTYGAHDSNASLVPYLVKCQHDFILNSTGTWCVSMHPTKDITFKPEELGKPVFYNLSVANQPIKTTILMGGREIDKYVRILKKIHNTDQWPEHIMDLYNEILQEQSVFITPGVVPGTGVYPNSTPAVIENGITYTLEDIESGVAIPPVFSNINKALAAVTISVALQTELALKMTGIEEGMPIYLEGGFRKNEGYTALLTALFPQNELSLTSMKEATSFGAAMLGKSAIEGIPLEKMEKKVTIEFVSINKTPFPYLDDFRKAFHNVVKEKERFKGHERNSKRVK